MSSIPPEVARQIENAARTEDLRALFGHPSVAVRVAAARKAGDLADSGACQVLTEAFVAAAESEVCSEPDYFREEVIIALGRVGGDGARDSILGVLDAYLERGPRTERYIWHDGEYTSVVGAAIRVLAEWSGDQSVYERLGRIAQEGSETLYSASMREDAFAAVMQENMRREGLVSLQARCEYLFALLTGPGVGHAHDWVAGKTGVKTLEALRNAAIVQVLISYGEPVRPLVQAELERTSAHEDERGEGLSAVIGRLDRDRRKSLQSQCEANLSELARAVLTFADEHNGTLPSGSSWAEDTKAYLEDAVPLFCPASEASPAHYAMNPAVSGRRLADIPHHSRTVLLYEVGGTGEQAFPHSGSGTGYAFVDGHVATYPKDWPSIEAPHPSGEPQ